jgi:hypothetical protein
VDSSEAKFGMYENASLSIENLGSLSSQVDARVLHSDSDASDVDETPSTSNQSRISQF